MARGPIEAHLNKATTAEADLLIAQGHPSRIEIDYVVLTNNAASGNRVQLLDGVGGAVRMNVFLNPSTSVVVAPRRPIAFLPNTAVRWTLSAATAVDISVYAEKVT